ncbi:MAG: flagellar biosynthetic protein FliR [Simkaniaceae bacterium]|nr:flagellar biosynthetic protein FliR [Simkaniaceae bacterium]
MDPGYLTAIPYLDMMLEIPKMDPMALLSIFLLGCMRAGPIVILNPFFGGNVMPMPVRAGTVIFFSILMMPTMIGSAHEFPHFTGGYIFLCCKEVIVGYALIYLINAPFFIVQSAGTIIDYERGASMMMSQDPTMKLQTSTLGTFYNQILIVIFYMLDGPFLFMDAYASTYSVIPIDGVLHSAFFNLKIPFWVTCTNMVNHIFTMAIQMASPAIVGVLIAETFLGIANRLAPQVQIVFLGQSLKSYAAMLLIWAGWFITLNQYGKMSINWVEKVQALIKMIPFYNVT